MQQGTENKQEHENDAYLNKFYIVSETPEPHPGDGAMGTMLNARGISFRPVFRRPEPDQPGLVAKSTAPISKPARRSSRPTPLAPTATSWLRTAWKTKVRRSTGPGSNWLRGWCWLLSRRSGSSRAMSARWGCGWRRLGGSSPSRPARLCRTDQALAEAGVDLLIWKP
jgi:hypothetical protein